MHLYIDGPTEKEIKKLINLVDGFTFNPSLLKKLLPWYTPLPDC